MIRITLPDSIETYTQERGRAGRDGLPAECIVVYNPNDVNKLLRLNTMQHRIPGIKAMKEFAENTTSCRRNMLLRYFDDKKDIFCRDFIRPGFKARFYRVS